MYTVRTCDIYTVCRWVDGSDQWWLTVAHLALREINCFFALLASNKSINPQCHLLQFGEYVQSLIEHTMQFPSECVEHSHLAVT